MAEPENLVLEHLRAIRGEMTKINVATLEIVAEMAAVRHMLEHFKSRLKTTS